jgi:hypothetical protein
MLLNIKKILAKIGQQIFIVVRVKDKKSDIYPHFLLFLSPCIVYGAYFNAVANNLNL